MAFVEPLSYLAIEIEVDMEKQVVTDVVVTSCPRLCESMVVTYIIGKNPVDGIAGAKEIIEQRYHGLAKGAIMAALQNTLQEYLRRRAAV